MLFNHKGYLYFPKLLSVIEPYALKVTVNNIMKIDIWKDVIKIDIWNNGLRLAGDTGINSWSSLLCQK